VIYTLVGDPFVSWCEAKVELRNQHILDSQDKTVMLDPEIAAILKSSNSISVAKGISNNLLKSSAKRRRSKAQIEEEKQTEQR